MSKAGQKILAGAREALSIVRGEAMPARVTGIGWATWSVEHGLGNIIYGEEKKAHAHKDDNDKVVRVMVQTI